MNTKRLTASAAIALAFGCNPAAEAATYQNTGYWEHGTALCQPAREYPDLRIRQREIDNIGSSNAYVVCSLKAPVDGVPVGSLIYFTNNLSTGNVRVVCNIQDTGAHWQSVLSERKEAIIAPQERLAIHSRFLTNPSAQCILPPGASITMVQIQYENLVEKGGSP